jgi:hypothetical protein
MHPALGQKLQPHLIIDPDGQHEARKIMIAVSPLSEHLEPKIDLGRDSQIQGGSHIPLFWT